MPIPNIPTVEAALLEKTNSVRAQHHLNPLTPNPALTQAARTYATYLATTNQFSHNANRKTPGDRVRLEGYEWCKIGENLALRRNTQGFTTQTLVEDVMQGWMRSPDHKKNLLEPYATEIGIGVAKGQETSQKFISVQLFARPATLRFPIEIKNTTSFSVPYTLNGHSKIISPQEIIRHWACEPQTFKFQPNVRSQISSRYEAQDKTLFILSEDPNHTLDVQVFPAP